MGRAAVAPLPPEGGGGFVVGEYFGNINGQGTQDINLGFQPKIVLIFRADDYTPSFGVCAPGMPYYSSEPGAVVTETGFRVGNYGGSNLNFKEYSGHKRRYTYIAFR